MMNTNLFLACSANCDVQASSVFASHLHCCVRGMHLKTSFTKTTNTSDIRGSNTLCCRWEARSCTLEDSIVDKDHRLSCHFNQFNTGSLILCCIFYWYLDQHWSLLCGDWRWIYVPHVVRARLLMPQPWHSPTSLLNASPHWVRLSQLSISQAHPHRQWTWHCIMKTC